MFPKISAICNTLGMRMLSGYLSSSSHPICKAIRFWEIIAAFDLITAFIITCHVAEISIDLHFEPFATSRHL